MMEQKPCRADLMNHINAVSFAVDDAKLFLDTHPCDSEALAYFEEHKNARNYALCEYAKYYGPLTVDSSDSSMDYWKWINDPWPWQKGGC